METLSAGIAVFATDVGGTSEIVDNIVYRLLPKDVTVEEPDDELKAFYTASTDTKLSFRCQARNRWQERCNADIVYHQFAEFISQS